MDLHIHMNESPFDTFKGHVIRWAEDRQIIPNAKPYVQIMKTGSELGELLDAEIKGDQPGIIDGIGDVLVTLIIYAKLQGVGFPKPGIQAPSEATPHEQLMEASIAYADLLHSHMNLSLSKVAKAIGHMVYELELYANLRGVTLAQCLAAAYREIKDRKGTLLPNGCFVKEEA